MDPQEIPVQTPTTVVTPPQPASVQPSSKKPFVILGVIIAFLIIFAGVAYFFLSNKTAFQSPSVSSDPPAIKTTDMSPGVPNSQKTIVTVQHSDSSQEKFIMSTSMVNDYMKALPEGDKVVSQSPAQ